MLTEAEKEKVWLSVLLLELAYISVILIVI